MKVIYPVLFYEEKDNDYSVFIPDLDNVSTCGNSLEDAIKMTEDLIAGIVVDKMKEKNEIPKASKIEDVSFNDLENSLNIKNWDYISKFKTYIMVDIDKFTEKWGKELIKKTVNIPKWVNTKAEEMKRNFSKTLEEALLKKYTKNKIFIRNSNHGKLKFYSNLSYNVDLLKKM